MIKQSAVDALGEVRPRPRRRIFSSAVETVCFTKCFVITFRRRGRARTRTAAAHSTARRC
jgi:hypothetical protein